LLDTEVAMKSSFTRFLAPSTAFAFAAMLAACCCDSSSRCCDPCSGGGASPNGGPSAQDKSLPDGKKIAGLHPATTFQRLVVTNKHPKPIRVTPMGAGVDGLNNPIEIPFVPAFVVVGPNARVEFEATKGGVTSATVTYQEASDPSPFAETVDFELHHARNRCIVGYEGEPMDRYVIQDDCSP
jgi:hypothetical protein